MSLNVLLEQFRNGAAIDENVTVVSTDNIELGKQWFKELSNTFESLVEPAPLESPSILKDQSFYNKLSQYISIFDSILTSVDADLRNEESNQLQLALTQLMKPIPIVWVTQFDVDPQGLTRKPSPVQLAFTRCFSAATKLANNLYTHKLSFNAKVSLILNAWASSDTPWTSESPQPVLNITVSAEQAYSIITQIVVPIFRNAKAPNKPSHTGESKESQLLSLTEPRTYDATEEGDPALVQRYWAVPMFITALSLLTESQVKDSWRDITMVTLNLLDDTNSWFRIQGCVALESLLRATSDQFWTRTGIHNVYWESIQNYMSFIPPMTPVNESIALLTATFKCANSLAKKSLPLQKDAIIAQLDETVIRQGLLKIYNMAGTNILINILVLNQIPIYCDTMGIYIVRHLMPLLDIPLKTLSDPFITASPELADAALDALTSLVKTAWPRINQYKYDIVDSCLVYRQRSISDEKSGISESSEQKIQYVFQMLDGIVGEESFTQDLLSLKKEFMDVTQ
ncbi:hypothetical protein CANCADRAFT_44857 [Tortispora caseinolytica NRRL Y-17796]|uniref:Uncharacterized protein n=1 Tax=Tortispora caseinolytica NRRL Y-17796 TaxID=767744 RepID=A0A1E4THN6_9ASCO|nr:hypothetical protein CANCADRAFT_44857 [Tortispora caseinolytica NRRL Y-17796]